MNMNVFKVDISTPQKSWTFENVVSCSAPGKKGNFQVLFNHAPLISQLETGEIKIQIAEKTTYFATGGGFLEVNNNNVTLYSPGRSSTSKSTKPFTCRNENWFIIRIRVDL